MWGGGGAVCVSLYLHVCVRANALVDEIQMMPPPPSSLPTNSLLTSNTSQSHHITNALWSHVPSLSPCPPHTLCGAHHLIVTSTGCKDLVILAPCQSLHIIIVLQLGDHRPVVDPLIQSHLHTPCISTTCTTIATITHPLTPSPHPHHHHTSHGPAPTQRCLPMRSSERRHV